MRIDSRDRLSVKGLLQETRISGRTVPVLIPIFGDGAFDQDTQSGLDISDGTGTGRTVGWEVYQLVCHIRPVDESLITWGPVPSGVQSGDTLLYVSPQSKALMQRARDNEYAYLVIDGDTFRVTGITAVGIGQAEEYAVTCKKFSPVMYQKQGY